MSISNIIGAMSFIGNSSRNFIDNSDMQICQRATSLASAPTGTMIVDRFAFNFVSSTGVFTTSQSTTVPTFAQSGHTSKFSAKIACTTADSSIAAGEYAHIQHAIEGYDYLSLEGKTVTLSFWVRSSKTGIYCATLASSTNDKNYVFEYTIASVDTWQKITKTLTLNYSGGTWDYTNGAGLYLRLSLMAGSTFNTATADAWGTSAMYATANQVNWCDSNTATFYLSQVKFEVGSSATQFVGNTFADDLAKCQRYYLDWQGVNGSHLWLDSWLPVGQNQSVTFGFPVQMRISPTVTKTGTWAVGNTGQPTIYVTTPNGTTLLISATPGSGRTYATPNGVAATGLTASAEL